MKLTARHIISLFCRTGALPEFPHTSAPRLDYKSIGTKPPHVWRYGYRLTDNHKLYINAAEWIGTPYRPAATANKNGLFRLAYPNFIRKPTAYAYRAVRTPVERKQQDSPAATCAKATWYFHQPGVTQESGFM